MAVLEHVQTGMQPRPTIIPAPEKCVSLEAYKKESPIGFTSD